MQHKLTDRQQSLKEDYCIFVVGAFAALTVWSALWLTAGLLHGAVSILHMVVLVLASYGVRLFWRIAMSD